MPRYRVTGTHRDTGRRIKPTDIEAPDAAEARRRAERAGVEVETIEPAKGEHATGDELAARSPFAGLARTDATPPPAEVLPARAVERDADDSAADVPGSTNSEADPDPVGGELLGWRQRSRWPALGLVAWGLRFVAAFIAALGILSGLLGVALMIGGNGRQAEYGFSLVLYAPVAVFWAVLLYAGAELIRLLIAVESHLAVIRRRPS